MNAEKTTTERSASKRGVYTAFAILFTAVSLLLVSLSLMVFSHARYVAEVGGKDVEYDLQNPFAVSNQQELFNAIVSGYGYVRLADGLDAPIIMTGDSLDLKADLTIDLNGGEIQRNNRGSLLKVTDGNTFTVVDSKGGGGLYNPIGSVLTVGAGTTGVDMRGEGGNLNVFGGTFESGPRPSEYYSTFESQISSGDVTFQKYEVDGVTVPAGTTGTMPILTMRGSSRDGESEAARARTGEITEETEEGGEETEESGEESVEESATSHYTGNVYFDQAFTGTCSAVGATGTVKVPADTYCFMVIEGATSDSSTAAYDITAADFVYSYVLNGEKVQVFGYTKDIESSMPVFDANGAQTKAAPYYSAVFMEGGKLNVDITAADGTSKASGTYGSFYSYFGTWYTSCVYIEAGEMTVSTSGEFATVNPADLSTHVKTNGTRRASARYGEGSCILAAGGKLDIEQCASATAYNGSVISVSGGEVSIKNANLYKYPTISHANSPFNIVDSAGNLVDVNGEFPAGRQYRDAAVFVNGGTLDITNSEIQVYKELDATLAQSDGLGSYKASFGILSRGRSDAKESNLTGKGVRILMHGSHSYGIMATRGHVELMHDTVSNNESKIIVDSDNSCYGVYAINKGVNTATNRNRVVNVTLNGADIEIGPRNGVVFTDKKWSNIGTLNTSTYVGSDPTDFETMTGASGAMKPASIGVYLEFTNQSAQPRTQNGGTLADEDRAKVNVLGASVSSKEIGVAVNGGILTFSGSGSINAYNASAIGLRGGDLEFASGSSFNIKSEINRKGNGVAKNSDGADTSCSISSIQATAAGTHQYNLFVPWQVGNDYIPWQRGMESTIATKSPYPNTDGIYVIGGNLSAHGNALNVNFRGLYNDFDGVYTTKNDDKIYFDNFKIKSFAVCGSGGNITIDSADINVTVGGGVKVDGKGSIITLGKDSSSDISVKTWGRAHICDSSDGDKNMGFVGPTSTTGKPNPLSGINEYAKWWFFPIVSGGHAVVARSGSIFVYGGSYEAVNCNGLVVTNDGESESHVNIYGGTFSGEMQHDNNAHSITAHRWAGNNTVLVGNEWTTMGPASHYGMQISGQAEVNISGGMFKGKNGGAYIRGQSASATAKVNVTAGTFGDGTSMEGINTSDYSTLVFGAGDASTNKDKLILDCNQFCISMNSLVTGGIVDAYLTINYGKFKTDPTLESCMVSASKEGSAGSYSSTKPMVVINGCTTTNKVSTFDTDKYSIASNVLNKWNKNSGGNYTDFYIIRFSNAWCKTIPTPTT